MAEQKLLTKADASRLVTDLTPDGIKAAADSGRLRVAARTKGGVRLFALADVEAFALRRKHHRKEKLAQEDYESAVYEGEAP